MADKLSHRIRLKLPGGAEFEAEGSPEFVDRERKEFLGSLRQVPAIMPEAAQAPLGQPHIAWDSVTEIKDKNIQLRAKLGGGRSEKDACLVLLAASQRLLNQPKPTATQLAKWLRNSGYPILRMDRSLQDAVTQGELLSSGSRRARRYELTAPGRLKAYILANQLTAAITGNS
ncbi:MAG: hypothetical protein A3J74_09495 [Elusimicrobia bacterium RIFCSPHIGHO2_02_FULL_57_9]|nr:MAG: hypothetical protein A3J74_09495 [Elusimicrobia bacterium RIFCSPHIGHO2_02_FULL_57_9]